jgi:hypothetical protein
MAAFYTRLLGAGPIVQSDGMSIFMVSGTKIFIYRKYDPVEGELAPNNHIALSVEDVDVACKMLLERGLVLEIPPIGLLARTGWAADWAHQRARPLTTIGGMHPVVNPQDPA